MLVSGRHPAPCWCNALMHVRAEELSLVGASMWRGPPASVQIRTSRAGAGSVSCRCNGRFALSVKWLSRIGAIGFAPRRVTAPISASLRCPRDSSHLRTPDRSRSARRAAENRQEEGHGGVSVIQLRERSRPGREGAAVVHATSVMSNTAAFGNQATRSAGVVSNPRNRGGETT